FRLIGFAEGLSSVYPHKRMKGVGRPAYSDESLNRRISLATEACSSKVRRNSCLPSGRATKYMKSTSAGSMAASMLALPGDAIGPGGSPGCRYVLYGESISRSR